MPWTLLMRPTVILGILLGLSVLTNVGLWKLHSRDLVKIGGLEALRADAVADAVECSKATEHLRQAAEKRDREVTARLLVAEAAAKRAEKKSDATLQERPTTPDQPCVSAMELNRRKLRERKAP